MLRKVNNNNIRLFAKTKHVKVWISRAMYERDIKEFTNAREIYEAADKYLKDNSGAEERLMLLESWREME